MNRPQRSRGSLRPQILGAALSLWVVSMLCGCSRPEPLDGCWGYAWGTPRDSILADLPHIRMRLGEARFGVAGDSLRLVFSDVQYGFGYGEVTLDFTPEGRLWHGRVRIPAGGEAILDSVREDLRTRFGSADSKGEYRSEGGYATLWASPDWIDRDFYSTGIVPALDRENIRALDYHSVGCLGECPIFSVRFSATGAAWLWSVEGYGEPGGFRADFDPARFAALAGQAADPRFLALADYYGYRGNALQRRRLEIDYGRFARLTESTEAGGPAFLEALLDSLETSAGALTWTQIVSWDTIPMFDRARVGLDSLEALGGGKAAP